jgi:hypothetical protein
MRMGLYIALGIIENPDVDVDEIIDSYDTDKAEGEAEKHGKDNTGR